MLIACDNKPVNVIIRYKDGAQKTVVGYNVDEIAGLLIVTTKDNDFTEEAEKIKSVLFNGVKVWEEKMVKLWKVTVNEWGRDFPFAVFAASREEALQKARKYPAYDFPVYAGRFTKEHAKKLLEGGTEE